MVRKFSTVLLVATVLAPTAAADTLVQAAVTPLPLRNAPFTLASVDKRCFYAPQPDGFTTPISPYRRQGVTAPIRGGLNEPRGQYGVHFGNDEAASVSKEAVYALRAGTVNSMTIKPGHFGIGDYGHAFSYWHVLPVASLHDGEHVAQGQLLGHVLPASWHVHISEFSRSTRNDCGAVDPRRPTGPFHDARNTEAPTIGSLYAYVANSTAFPTFSDLRRPSTAPDTATPLSLTDLHGTVDFRTSILDHPVHQMGPKPGPQIGLAPSAIRAYLAPRSAPSTHYRHMFQFDGSTVIPARPGILRHLWAYGTYRSNSCYFHYGNPDIVCGIQINWHVGGPKGFDTRSVNNGTYLYCVSALQIENHAARHCTPVTIKN